MNIAGRRRHRLIFSGLIVAVPAFLVIGILLRPDVPPVTELPDELRRLSGAAAKADWNPVRVDSDGYVFFVGAGTADGDESPPLWIQPARAMMAPELLVYWIPGEGIAVTSAQARLVGRLSGARRQALNLQVDTKPAGLLVIYSAAWQERLAQFALTDLVLR